MRSVFASKSTSNRLSRAAGAVLESLEVRRLMHVDPNHPDHFDPVPMSPVGTVVPATPHVGPFAALADVPELNSNLDATAQLYIDFDGAPSMAWGSYTSAVTPAYDTDGDATSFTAGELSNIEQIWSRVAELYSPFNINVTTVDPGNLSDKLTTRVIVGGTGSWYGSAGGVAYIGAFYNSAPNVAWVFPKMLANGNTKYTAEAISHESGHTFGLNHQSTYSGTKKTAEYNPGTSAKAPIMGNSYSAARATWWNGQSSLGSASIQNDATVISSSNNGYGYRPDDHGGDSGSATALDIDGDQISGDGIIEQTTDTDYFSFTTLAGDISLSVAPAQYSGMLDATLTLLDSDGATVATADTSGLGESLSLSVGAGTYYLVVSSKGNAGDLGQYTLSGSVITSPDYVARPASVSAVASEGTVTVSWTDRSNNETSFVIERSDDGGSSYDPVGTADAGATSFDDATVSVGHSYKYRVKATGSVQDSSYSAATTVNVIPETPANLAALSVSSSQIDLSWDDVDGETGYRIDRSTNGTTWTTLTSVDADEDSYASTGLAATTRYYYRIVALSGVGNSAATSAVNAITTPSTPTTFVGTVAADSVSLSWTNVAGETGYRVEYSADGDDWSSLATTAVNVVTYKHAGLSANQRFNYRVRAIGSGGESPASSTLTKTTLMGAPTDVYVFGASTGTLKVSWADTVGETGYRLERLAGGTWAQVGSNLAANKTIAAVTGLTGGTTYVFRVFAINTSGTSAASATATGTTAPAKPATISATATSATSIKLIWSNVAAEAGYRIERSTDGETWKWVGSAGVDATSFEDTSLTPETQYSYRMRGYSDAGSGAWSDTKNITTPASGAVIPFNGNPTRPVKPGSLKTRRISDDSIRLLWSDVPDELGFRIERSTDGVHWSVIKKARAGTTSYLDDNLVTGTYYYRVRAYNMAGTSPASGVVSRTV
jgi:fibronectin type 3 domain-containing protein